MITENEKHVAEDQSKIDSLKSELRDKSHRVNELEVRNEHLNYDKIEFNEVLKPMILYRDVVWR